MQVRIIAASLAAFALSSPAAAEERAKNGRGFYLGLTLAEASYATDNDFGDEDSGILAFGLIGLTAGYRFDDHLRADLELGAQPVDESFDQVGRLALSGYYDLRATDQPIVPYLGGGLGIADIGDYLPNAANFSWHAEAGVAFNINSTFAIVPAYRYTWIDDGQDRVASDAVDIHSIRLAGRVSF